MRILDFRSQILMILPELLATFSNYIVRRHNIWRGSCLELEVMHFTTNLEAKENQNLLKALGSSVVWHRDNSCGISDFTSMFQPTILRQRFVSMTNELFKPLKQKHHQEDTWQPKSEKWAFCKWGISCRSFLKAKLYGNWWIIAELMAYVGWWTECRLEGCER